ncbi:hypothetical protein HK099_002184 [Clydaea vesicula]|uniref:Solute carrier family 40 member n=1 Tax=Clydaea vesicula TaxID=447962 RepID=A0AAD5Y0X9_9FUNG|nr:hypothetical protein HK099_002184 [Clydaea vesicula]
MAVFSLLIIPVELVLVKVVYNSEPKLSQPKVTRAEAASDISVHNDHSMVSVLKKKFIQSWIIYYDHRVFLASIAMACLYFSVLSNGGQMIAVLKYRGVNDLTIVIMRGLGVLTGLAATYITPLIVSKIGLVRCGLWGLWSQMAFLLPIVIGFFIQGEHKQQIETWLLMIGVSLSRFGLWTFDLCETQILQEQVDNSIAGLISGNQYVFFNLGDLCSFLLTLIFSSPEDFYIPSLISIGSVFFGIIFYTSYVLKERGHLLHFKKSN